MIRTAVVLILLAFVAFCVRSFLTFVVLLLIAYGLWSISKGD